MTDIDNVNKKEGYVHRIWLLSGNGQFGIRCNFVTRNAEDPRNCAREFLDIVHDFLGRNFVLSDEQNAALADIRYSLLDGKIHVR